MRGVGSLFPVIVMMVTASAFSFAESHEESGKPDQSHQRLDRSAHEPTSPAPEPNVPAPREKLSSADESLLIKTSSQQVKFRKVSKDELRALGVTDPEAFGEAWEDPSGTVWGDVAKLPQESIHRGEADWMNHREAVAHCRKLGAELPTGYPEEESGKGYPSGDSDFVRLRKFLSGKTTGYVPEVLPNLTDEERRQSNVFWSSSIDRDDSRSAHTFYGTTGKIRSESRDRDFNPVRCIVRRHPLKKEVVRPYRRSSLTGAEFRGVSHDDLRALGISDPYAFGEAWEDPSGTIWGDIAKNRDGSARLVDDYYEAKKYCEEMGARLPSGYSESQNGRGRYPNRDSDMVRLFKYLGAKSVEDWHDKPGYQPHILPNLTYVREETGVRYGRYHWTSSTSPNGRSARYVGGPRDSNWDNTLTVRCVISRPQPQRSQKRSQ